ncbi:MAG TPA: FapA family protein, partial [Planctomycetota bacterium]|nr:FapA family protein [Planctomycetota bacterium]
MPDTSHPLAARSRPAFHVELLAEDGFTRGVVRVRRETSNVKLEDRDVVLVLRKAGVRLTDEVKQQVTEGVAKTNASTATQVSFVVAEGVAPVAGADAELRWAVDVVPQRRPRTDPHGRADFRHLDDNANVTAGQLLLTVVAAVRGTPGRDIFGDVIRPKTGHAADVRPGRNVTVSDDGTQYFARRDGRVRFAHGVLSVESVYEIHGSVDYAVGNVDFNGPVIVHGDVRGGFEVRSGDWIEVYGSVEGARVCAKGDVHVRGGVNGRGRCRIECGGSFSARYLNGATVEAAGDVEVVRSVLHSRVLCGGKFRIVTQGARASTIIAGGDVDIPVIGSRRAVEV